MTPRDVPRQERYLREVKYSTFKIHRLDIDLLIAMAFLALFLFTNVCAAGSVPPATIPRIEAMIQAIKNNKRGPGKSQRPVGPDKVYSFTEQEVNEYLSYWIENEARKGKNKEVSIKSGSVHLQSGHLLEADAIARLGGGSLKSLDGDPDSLLNRTLKNYLSVDNTVHAKVFIISAKGKLFIKAKDVRLKGVILPDAWVQKILQIVGKKQRPPLDFDKLFDLPNGIERVDILPQAIKIIIKQYTPGKEKLNA